MKNEHNNNNTKNIEQDHLMIKNEYIEFKKKIRKIKMIQGIKKVKKKKRMKTIMKINLKIRK